MYHRDSYRVSLGEARWTNGSPGWRTSRFAPSQCELLAFSWRTTSNNSNNHNHNQQLVCLTPSCVESGATVFFLLPFFYQVDVSAPGNLQSKIRVDFKGEHLHFHIKNNPKKRLNTLKQYNNY